MIKKEILIVLISTAIVIGIISIFAFFIIWIGFPANSPKDSFKDALSFTGSLFGGLATFGAAIIAAYLFNDWKDQEKTIFLRNVAYETSGLLLNLFTIMQGYTESKEGLLNQIMPIQSKIMLKLAILNRQIKDDQMHLVNNNFQGFIHDYIEAIKLYQHDRQALKEQVRILINSYSSELGYISELANLDNVFEKLKTARI